ncbi:hypothetical protein F5J12DRAFT_780082 [Pisolithus orientalis]|uniref:uncharacterized protein n=1 Tax=Pisolithus orientalis TaxID=936130 RepID=UPI00222412B6|nr:uncharacterized protein F5J12DRAFT_780082 [Pisolithus orientalis]KAI6028409.1 hypothetical protein F5J12DRAFT_780082 [Pisolithus orientalis]
MANLQGLNVVHAAQEPPHADLQDTLTSPFPDFSAHLDLWTNLTFDSTDDPHHRHRNKPSSSEEDRDDDNQSPPPLDISFQDNHDHPPTPRSAAAVPPFDINSLLASFGANPFVLPPAPAPVPQQNNAAPSQFSVIPSLAQLIALQTAHGVNYPVPPPPAAVPAQPAAVQVPVQPPPAPVPISVPVPQPPAKRPRTAKSQSLGSDHSDVSAAQSPQDPASPATSTTQTETTSQVFAAAEDKRRRNTAASARFRLKKKEREAALERRAKELEDRVLELERECEGLRRENGWLKGLVVGVTGAGATQQPQQQQK